MTPDITIKDHYYKFINDAKEDEDNYNKQLSLCHKTKDEVFNLIKEHKDFYKDFYDIDLDYYINDLIEKGEALYLKSIKFANAEQNSSNRVKLLQIVKYCNILKRIREYNKLIILAKERKKITLTKYRTVVTNYYDEVHKCILEGNGYKFSKGIGIFCINRWLMDSKRMAKRKRLDYQATANKKKELINAGIKLFNKAEYDWYKERNIPYDGVDYRVYKTETHYYDITIIKSNILSNSAMMFKHTEYVNSKHRGKSFEDMSNMCKDINDIKNFQVDIRYKLNMLLHKYPNRYLLYIRNEEQERYKPGAHN